MLYLLLTFYYLIFRFYISIILFLGPNSLSNSLPPPDSETLSMSMVSSMTMPASMSMSTIGGSLSTGGGTLSTPNSTFSTPTNTPGKRRAWNGSLLVLCFYLSLIKKFYRFNCITLLIYT